MPGVTAQSRLRLGGGGPQPLARSGVAGMNRLGRSMRKTYRTTGRGRNPRKRKPSPPPEPTVWAATVDVIDGFGFWYDPDSGNWRRPDGSACDFALQRAIWRRVPGATSGAVLACVRRARVCYRGGRIPWLAAGAQ